MKKYHSKNYYDSIRPLVTEEVIKNPKINKSKLARKYKVSSQYVGDVQQSLKGAEVKTIKATTQTVKPHTIIAPKVANKTEVSVLWGAVKYCHLTSP